MAKAKKKSEVVDVATMETNYQNYQDVKTIMPHSTNEETLKSGSGVLVSKQRLANAVGFDYEKQIRLLSPTERKIIWLWPNLLMILILPVFSNMA